MRNNLAPLHCAAPCAAERDDRLLETTSIDSATMEAATAAN